MNEGDVIFLSASVPSREEWRAGARPAEIEEAIVSIARAVFSRGGRLLFGGHPSVSPLVAAVAGEYFKVDPTRPNRPIITFQSRFYTGKQPDETTDMVRLGWSDIVWTDRIPGAAPDDAVPSLREMRNHMLQVAGDAFKEHELRPPRAMIAVGGMEGISDEAGIFLARRNGWKHASPPRIFLFPSGGGAAAQLLDPKLQPGDLWRDKSKPDYEVFERLLAGLRDGDIVDVETAWRAKHPKMREILPRDIPFQPYAAMVQWVLDEELGPAS
jgi:hypothetical protein